MTRGKAKKNDLRRRAAAAGTNYTTALRQFASPPSDPNWPCPNGCTEPHTPGWRFPRCAAQLLFVGRRGDERCSDGCLSEELANREANPKLWIDLADSAMGRCHRCGFAVCFSCGTTPVDDDGSGMVLCGPCEEREVNAYWRAERDRAAHSAGGSVSAWEVEFSLPDEFPTVREVRVFLRDDDMADAGPGEGPTIEAITDALRRQELGTEQEPYKGPLMMSGLVRPFPIH